MYRFFIEDKESLVKKIIKCEPTIEGILENGKKKIKI
jgi:hypothetical protein